LIQVQHKDVSEQTNDMKHMKKKKLTSKVIRQVQHRFLQLSEKTAAKNTKAVTKHKAVVPMVRP